MCAVWALGVRCLPLQPRLTDQPHGSGQGGAKPLDPVLRVPEIRGRPADHGRVDFWWPGARVVGEFDGRVKYGRANPSGRPPEDVLWDEKLREDRLRAADAADEALG